MSKEIFIQIRKGGLIRVSSISFLGDVNYIDPNDWERPGLFCGYFSFDLLVDGEILHCGFKTETEAKFAREYIKSLLVQTGEIDNNIIETFN